jgi:rRNA maturation protein Nop10
MSEQDNKPVATEPVAYVVTVGEKISNEIGFFTSKEKAERCRIKAGGKHPHLLNIQELYFAAAPTPPAAQAGQEVVMQGRTIGNEDWFDLLPGQEANYGTSPHLFEYRKLYAHPAAQAVEEVERDRMDILLEVLDAKDVMRNAGIQQDTFGNMFKQFTQPAAVRSGASSEPLGAGLTGDVTECQRYYPDRYTGEMVPHQDGMYILLSDAQDCASLNIVDMRSAALEEAEEAVRTLYEADEPPYLVDIARAIRSLSSTPLNANELASSALNASQVPASEQGTVKLFVECRGCHSCGHYGLNDDDAARASCNTCGWTGDAPAEDKCPDCDHVGTMSAACPKCGERYHLICSDTLQSQPAQEGGDQ